MSFDGFFLHYMTDELKETISHGRIQKINQPFKNEVILTIRNHHQNYKLLLSATPTLCRVQLTNTIFSNPQTPNTFTMVMRKYLQGAIIEDIKQIENDRILEITVSNKSEVGDTIQVALIIEIMGKHSNVILINKKNHKIIEAIKHVGFTQNSYRTILPGSTYITPPSDHKINPYTINKEKLFSILHTHDLSPKDLQSVFQGIGRDTAKELACLLAKDHPFQAFQDFFHQDASPSMTQDSFSPITFHDTEATYPNLSDLLDSFYNGKAEKDRIKQQSSDLMLRVHNELIKNRKKLKKQEKELANTHNAENFRQKGELLTTFLHQIPNNQDVVRLDNYYTNQPIDIALNKALTPSQNAQKYFKKYQKLKEAVKHLNTLIDETKNNISYLESVETALSQANLSDIADIREELVHTGYIRKRKKEKTQKRKKAEPYLASDGKTLILVGRNNLQNDELSFKTARKKELWFHAKDIPGSHVLIVDNLNPSDAVKTDAAELAAYFSKARHSNLVPVDMIESQKLHKPSGAKPGFVTYRGQKTLRVTPNEDKIKSMKK